MEETIARPSDDETRGKGSACTLLSFATVTNVSALFICVIPTHWFPNWGYVKEK